MIKDKISKLVKGENLSADEMKFAIKEMMSGNADPASTAAFLTALAIKGETVDEVIAAVKVMRQLAISVPLSFKEPVVDSVGTGGEFSNLLNISTASCIVASAAGVKIAKYGNIASNSNSGSADVLAQAGVNLKLSGEKILEIIKECNFGFMYAPHFHSALKFVNPIRKSIAIRTIFNLLSPICNPSGVQYQVLGVYDKKWLRPLTEICSKLGSKHILAVSNEIGLDEFSVSHKNFVCELKKDGIYEFEVNPKDYGMNHSDNNLLSILNPKESLNLMLKIFKGEEKGIGLDMLALNTAAIFLVAEKTIYFKDGIELAKKTIESGAALKQLDKIVETSNKLTQ